MEDFRPNPKHLILFLIVTSLTLGIAQPTTLPPDLQSSAIAVKFRSDPIATQSAATDYGLIVKETPMAVFNPESTADIVTLMSLASNSSVSFGVAPRGQSHSVRGQAQVRNGIVVNMRSLSNFRDGKGIVIAGNSTSGYYADVGGEQLWIDVLRVSLQSGLSPLSWTDYLHLTVGGTLSNAGISGETFRHGPQINNVYEMDVVTGTGEFVTCSRESNSELFYAVLGGLGQFGIIMRARIALGPAPTTVKWVRLLYCDFEAFRRDQERLILDNGANPKNNIDYLEGQVLMANAPGGWADPFYSLTDIARITPLVNKCGTVYTIELATFYNDLNETITAKLLQLLFSGLRHVPGFFFSKDSTLMDFLNRVQAEEEQLTTLGLWQVPHPWLNLFVPKSRISDFNSGVFKNIMLKTNTTTPLILTYPMLRDKWDNAMSAAIPDEDIFYAVGFLHSSGFNNWQDFDILNAQILQFCDDAGIKYKQYLPHYSNSNDWAKHFGTKWPNFQSSKARFDPKMILSPGQGIFTSSS